MRYPNKTEHRLSLAGTIFLLLFAITTVAAYVTHLIWSITLLMANTSPLWNQIILAILGAFVPPIGTIHGFILWFS